MIDGNQIKAQQYTENIETYLLLSSDVHALNSTFSGEVKGTIEQPGYYFDRKNANAFIHLDLLLMTQGWRRFLWTDVLKDSLSSPKHGFENGVTISGQVLLPNGKPSKNAIDLVIMIRGGGFFTETTNANGRFALHDLDISDSTTVLVQGTKSNGSKNVNVLFDEPFIPAIKLSLEVNGIAYNRKELELWLSRKKEYEDLQESFKLNKVQTLKTVEIVAKREVQDSRTMLYRSSHYRTLKVDNTMCGSSD